MKDINLIDKSHLIESNTITNTKKVEEILASLKNVEFIVKDVSGISVDELDVTGFNVDQDIIDKLKKGITPTKGELFNYVFNDYVWSYCLYKTAILDKKPSLDKLIKDNGITDILKAYNSVTSSLEIVGNGKSETFTFPNGSTVTDKTNIRNIIYANELTDYVIPFADQRDGGPLTNKQELILPMIPVIGYRTPIEIPASDDNTCGVLVNIIDKVALPSESTIIDFVDLVIDHPGIISKDKTSTINMNLIVEPVATDPESFPITSAVIPFNIYVDASGKISMTEIDDKYPLFGQGLMGLALTPTEDFNRKRLKLIMGSIYPAPEVQLYYNVRYSFSTVSGNASIKILDRHKISTVYRMYAKYFGISGDSSMIISKYFVNTENIDEFASIEILDGQLELEGTTVASIVKEAVNDVKNGNFYHVGGNRNAR